MAKKQCKHFDVCGNKIGSNSRHLECSKCSSIRKRYGLTLAERNEMYHSQGGKCKCCSRDVMFYNTNTENPKGFERAVVDHCHTSGEIRGILCHSCNIALGLVQDDVETLLKLVNYLTK